jgi:AI-2 transport protein TqsA
MGDRDIRTMLAICTAILILAALAALYLARGSCAGRPCAFRHRTGLVAPGGVASAYPEVACDGDYTCHHHRRGVRVRLHGFLGFGKAVQWLIANAARFQALYDETAEWLESHGLYTAGMLAESYNVRWLILTVQRVAANVQSVIIFAALVFVL